MLDNWVAELASYFLLKSFQLFNDSKSIKRVRVSNPLLSIFSGGVKIGACSLLHDATIQMHRMMHPASNELY